MVRVDFVVQDGTLCLLGCSVGKRAGPAAIRIAVDCVSEGLVDVEEVSEV